MIKMMTPDLEQIMTTIPTSLTAKKALDVQQGDIVFYKGDVTTHVYLLLKGEVIVQNAHADGNVFLISNLSPGSFLGDLEAISGNLINATTLSANTDCTFLKFMVDDFLNALTLNNQLLLLVSRLLAQKMYQECYHLGDNHYKKGTDKLLLYITKAYRETEATPPLVIRKTRPCIASELGVSVKTINRGIKSLCSQQLIEVINGKINVSSQHYQSLLALLDPI